MECIWYDDIIHNWYDGRLFFLLVFFFFCFFAVAQLCWTGTLLLLLLYEKIIFLQTQVSSTNIL